MAEAGGLVLRPSRPEDEPAIRELLRSILPGNPKTDAAVMRWQYHDNPYGASRGWVWEDRARSRIVCHYATLPVPIRVDGRVRDAGIGVDAATAHGYQGRGLFGRVIEAAERTLAREGWGAVFFFPAAGSMIPSRARSYGWPFRTYVLPLDATWLARRARVPRAVARTVMAAAFRGPRIREARTTTTVPEGIDALWEDVSPHQPWGIVKSATWWTWRYGSHPHEQYRFTEVRRGASLRAVAASVVREAFGGRIVYILDLLAADGASAGAVIGAAVAEARAEAGADAVAMAAMPGTWPARSARAAGLRAAPRRLERNPVWLAVYALRARPEELLGPWAVTWGDMDHL